MSHQTGQTAQSLSSATAVRPHEKKLLAWICSLAPPSQLPVTCCFSAFVCFQAISVQDCHQWVPISSPPAQQRRQPCVWLSLDATFSFFMSLHDKSFFQCDSPNFYIRKSIQQRGTEKFLQRTKFIHLTKSKRIPTTILSVLFRTLHWCCEILLLHR